jgi:putative peptidoglycan lipid II flippase
MFMLRRTMNVRIGRTGLPSSLVAKLWLSAAVAAAIAWGIKLELPTVHPIVAAALILGSYGLAYFGMTAALRVSEAASTLGRLYRRSA